MKFSLFSGKEKPGRGRVSVLWWKVVGRSGDLAPVLFPPAFPHVLLARHEGFS